MGYLSLLTYGVSLVAEILDGEDGDEDGGGGDEDEKKEGIDDYHHDMTPTDFFGVGFFCVCCPLCILFIPFRFPALFVFGWLDGVCVCVCVCVCVFIWFSE